MNSTNYEFPHCGAFPTPHSHRSWIQIFASNKRQLRNINQNKVVYEIMSEIFHVDKMFLFLRIGLLYLEVFQQNINLLLFYSLSRIK